jgi:GTP1/Obg family GTP-binding protein
MKTIYVNLLQPLIVALNKIDVTPLSSLDDDRKAVLQHILKENCVMEMSTLTEQGVIEVKQEVNRPKYFPAISLQLIILGLRETSLRSCRDKDSSEQN